MITIDLSILTKNWKTQEYSFAVKKSFYKKNINLVLNYLWKNKSKKNLLKANYSFEVCLTDNKDITVYNGMYFKKDRPTNVLSFPNFQFNPSCLNWDEVFLNENKKPTHRANPNLFLQNTFNVGSMIFAFETILKESIDQQKTFQSHLTHLTIHSVLHLLGFDHMNKKDEKQMQAIEVEIMQSLGFSNPYFI